MSELLRTGRMNEMGRFEEAIALYQKADYSQCEFAKYNPPFECESEVFNLPENSNHKFIGTMLQRNAFLLSRLFIKNSNFTPTSGKTKFLDIGCGIALDLPGIYACSGGEDNVDYLGVDIDSAMISQNQHIYRNYINTKFIAENAVKVLTSPENKHKFDVILVQHPNICTWHSSEGFKNIFSALIFCTAFEEIRQLFRMKNKTRAEHRGIFSLRIQQFNELFLAAYYMV